MENCGHFNPRHDPQPVVVAVAVSCRVDVRGETQRVLRQLRQAVSLRAPLVLETVEVSDPIDPDRLDKPFTEAQLMEALRKLLAPN